MMHVSAADCSSVAAQGELQSQWGATVQGTLQYRRCAKSGEALFQLSGDMDGTLEHAGVRVGPGRLLLHGEKLNGGEGRMTWNGELSGEGSLFGGTSRVRIAVAGNVLGAVEVSTEFTTPSGLLSGSVAFGYSPCADAMGGGGDEAPTDVDAGEGAASSTTTTTTGKVEGRLRLKGAGEVLGFKGEGSFDSCTG
eukprot:Sspe_Gene.501::Locus_169_Transcript_1_1_Confidence_1.000_Length_1842::g.501::m.501